MEGNPLDILEEKIRMLIDKFGALRQSHEQVKQELKAAQERIERLEIQLRQKEEEKANIVQKVEGLIEKINQLENL